MGPRRHIVFAFRSRYKKPQILLHTHGTSVPYVVPPPKHDRSFLRLFCHVAPVRPVALTPSASEFARFWQFKGPPGVTFAFLTSKPWE